MKECIETRFDIGDAVYIPDNYEEYVPNLTPYVIYGIQTKYYADKTKILYEVKQNDRTDCVVEEWLCATYDECVQWCKKHNKH